MNPKRSELSPNQHELLEKRKELHGKRRLLHERLSEVCEDFVLGDLNRAHKQKALLGELQYLTDYYRDESSWDDVQ